MFAMSHGEASQSGQDREQDAVGSVKWGWAQSSRSVSQHLQARGADDAGIEIAAPFAENTSLTSDAAHLVVRRERL